MSQMAFGKGRLVSGMGTAPCKVIPTHTQVRAAEGLQGFKFVLQKAQQVPGIDPVPRNKCPGGNWMLPSTETGALEGQCDTGSPRLWGKGRMRDKGLTECQH